MNAPDSGKTYNGHHLKEKHQAMINRIPTLQGISSSWIARTVHAMRVCAFGGVLVVPSASACVQWPYPVDEDLALEFTGATAVYDVYQGPGASPNPPEHYVASFGDVYFSATMLPVDRRIQLQAYANKANGGLKLGEISRSFPTRFYPTSVEFDDNGDLYVAGISSEFVVIEKWDVVGAKLYEPDPDGPLFDPNYSPSSIGVGIVNGADVRSVDLVYRAAAGTFGGEIYSLGYVRGSSPPDLLGMTWDSHGVFLYAGDPIGGAPKATPKATVAWPTSAGIPQPGQVMPIIVEPNLYDHRWRFMGDRLNIDGSVYYEYSHLAASPFEESDHMFLIDSGNPGPVDGEIDGVVVLTSQDYVLGQYGSTDQWLD